jgi:translation elongation factor EF-1beta
MASLNTAAKSDAGKGVKVEKDALLLDVFPDSDHADLAELDRCIHDIKLPGLCWAREFKAEDVAFGIKKLCVAAILEDKSSLDTQAVQDAIHKVPHVRSVEFSAFTRI